MLGCHYNELAVFCYPIVVSKDFSAAAVDDFLSAKLPMNGVDGA